MLWSQKMMKISSKENKYKRAILVKNKNLMPENVSFQGCFTKVSFVTSEGNQMSYFQNGYFF